MKCRQAVSPDSWPLHGVMGIQVNQRFIEVVALDPNLFVSLHLIKQTIKQML